MQASNKQSNYGVIDFQIIGKCIQKIHIKSECHERDVTEEKTKSKTY